MIPVTVIIPTRCSLSGLANALDSLNRLLDKYVLQVLIGMHNCCVSTEFVSYALSRYTNLDLRFIPLNGDYHLSGVLNRLWAQASTQYIMRMDDDDICLPSRLRTTLSAIKQYPDAAIIGFPCYYHHYGYQPRISCLDRSAWSDPRLALLGGVPFAHPTILINSLKTTDKYDETLKYAQDYGLYVDNIKAKIAYVNTPVLIYNAPSRTVALDSKRVVQLACHDAVLWRLMKKIGIPLSISDARAIRQRFVTSEDISIYTTSKNVDTFSLLAQATYLLKRFCSSVE